MKLERVGEETKNDGDACKVGEERENLSRPRPVLPRVPLLFGSTAGDCELCYRINAREIWVFQCFHIGPDHPNPFPDFQINSKSRVEDDNIKHWKKIIFKMRIPGAQIKLFKPKLLVWIALFSFSFN